MHACARLFRRLLGWPGLGHCSQAHLGEVSRGLAGYLSRLCKLSKLCVAAVAGSVLCRPVQAAPPPSSVGCTLCAGSSSLTTRRLMSIGLCNVRTRRRRGYLRARRAHPSFVGVARHAVCHGRAAQAIRATSPQEVSGFIKEPFKGHGVLTCPNDPAPTPTGSGIVGEHVLKRRACFS